MPEIFQLNSDLSGENEETPKTSTKFAWYWAPVFCLVWFLLFYVVVVPSFYSYPKQLLICDENQHPDEFIGERAQIQLIGLASIGVKLAGTVENEVYAVNYLLDEINKIKAASRKDLYDIDVDVQYSSGKFMLWGMAISYKNVSNVIVRLSHKKNHSGSYLLVNSHYDSEIGTPAAADAGVMIVIMLETLRVISRSEKELRNPIVFLLNGAEESKLLGSHGFITQHPWAEHCKALINLDSAGSGGREVLFQSGPGHPWLMKYYKKSARHPYATTVAEELFQAHFIPSDTDFRIFRDYRGVPGVDMAHTLNGYVYHTKYDNFQNLERGTYQTTGDNVLALTWALANSEELENPEAHAGGHTVFYDYLGWFMIFYTEHTGKIINIITSVSASAAICVSVLLMAKRKTCGYFKNIFLQFGVILLVQVLTVAAAVGITLLMAVIIDAMGLTMAWYSEEWLLFGLYFCPMFFVLGMFPAIYISCSKKKMEMALNDIIACFMHSHCIILAVICIWMTSKAIRSAFFPMIAVFFHTISVVLNLLSEMLCKKSLHLHIHLICQIFPFWFYTYMSFAFTKTFVPMQGRDGPTSKPDLLLAGIVAITSLHFAGFILPVLHKFRNTKLLFSVFGVLTVLFVIIAATPAGFPYKPDVAAQRFNVLHTHRVIHDERGFVIKNDSGFYVHPSDARPKSLDDTTLKEAAPQSWMDTECSEEAFCGLALYSAGWINEINFARWIPAPAPILVIQTELKLTKKLYLTEKNIRFSFSLKSADRAVIYIDPYPHTRVTNWTFDLAPIEKNYKSPYFVYHFYSMDASPLEFDIEIEVKDPGSQSFFFYKQDSFDYQRESTKLEGATLRLGVGVHFLYHTHTYTDKFKAFLKTFPDWTYITHWTAGYDSWIF